ncbi:MAG: UDP-N-acetylmuramate dehydrogenase [Bryobacteraceae bacterium]
MSPVAQETAARLTEIPNLYVEYDALLRLHTRFGVGGPAHVLARTSDPDAFVAASRVVKSDGLPFVVIGGGTNLVVSDEGYDGVVLQYTAKEIRAQGTRVHADAGAVLQDLVDFTIDRGLAGIHTMTGIPGWVGAAVYGNAGAYGRSIDQSIVSVRFYDGAGIRVFNREQCRFHYRESIFKDRKGWIILSTELELTEADAGELRAKADEILKIRNAKYPPSMKCAGSIFKNLLLAELPEPVQRHVDPKVIREGKVPSAYFLELVGAKGMTNGDIHVADYHANLIYNAGDGTAEQISQVVDELKRRVKDRFGLELEEEVQYVGFA